VVAYIVHHKNWLLRMASSVLSRQKLPHYMIPSAFVFLKTAFNPNGKIDRRALPQWTVAGI